MGLTEAQIDSDPDLAAVKQKLAAELGSVSKSDLPQMNPLIVIALISLAIQIFVSCRSKHSHETVVNDIKNVHKLSWYKLWRFRRSLKQLARNDSRFTGVDIDKAYTAMFNVAEQLTDTQIAALLADR